MAEDLTADGQAVADALCHTPGLMIVAGGMTGGHREAARVAVAALNLPARDAAVRADERAKVRAELLAATGASIGERNRQIVVILAAARYLTRQWRDNPAVTDSFLRGLNDLTVQLDHLASIHVETVDTLADRIAPAQDQTEEGT